MRMSDAQVFPRNLWLGGVGNDKLIYDYGREVARECALMGVHVNFAPVLDVIDRPGAVVGNRSFGSSPDVAASNGIAFAKGLEDGGVLSTAKHFPGHGSTTADSHKELPLIDKSLQEMMLYDVEPFKKYIANTIKSFVKNGIDAYLESKAQDKLQAFHDHVKKDVGACMEDKGKKFIEYRQNNLEGPIDRAEEAEYNTIINRNKSKTLKEQIETELNVLFNQNPEGEWKDYAPVIKERLVGKVATVIVLNENNEFTELKENGKVVVRALTSEDIDRIGETLYNNIMNG